MRAVLTTLFLVFTGLAIFSSCFAPSAKEKGKMLADKYCSSCHLPVDPSLLDKETWTKHVLPAMAPKLGIRVWSGDQYYPVEGKPQPGQISFNEWVELVKYYETQAPAKLTPAKPPVPLQRDWFGFSMKHPVGVDSPGLAATTLVSFDTATRHIFTSDSYTSTLDTWDSSLRKTGSRKMPSPVVDILYTRDGGKSSPAIITQIGNMRALDAPAGIISELNINDLHSKQKDLMPFLKRPVQTLQADFDKDSLVDLLVCAFGHNQGGLYWLKQLPDHRYEQKTITEVPGAIHAAVGDFNGDGWPDAMVLFAAADEGIWLYENDRHGGFKSTNLLRFPPLNGSTSFQLVDFNQDGKLDILYTCGDNADFSMVLKPYHGLYVYINEGNNSYRQAWFYPVNGCTKAVAADFNLDGKTDIAAIAFFADMQNNPAEKFILFEGKDHQLNFTPHAPPIEKEGRWICMDVKDIDGDGDEDIILGNYGRGFVILDGYKPDWKEYQPFIVLENKQK
ncbi:FG-GAP repeat domain-containing protein [Chitinophaga qingshengii]|uniref:VCBS repeat-containing protein n=1 Tax=Chitinophaga qingshengii TaxID=1569794 RepID=A0ABR7TKL0_9BACT|nr:VCBS repeat-containing protein [Chitinophaga qingshengii]MBC9930994.1 VCBS repeat-containing protein [Chitinophaga qingshengii]